MGFVTRNAGVFYGFLVLSIFAGTVAFSQSPPAPEESTPNFEPGDSDGGVERPPDAGVEDNSTDAIRQEPAANALPARVIRDDERPEKKSAPAKVDWRHDPSLRRRPGSYIGGVLGYAMGHAWYTTTKKDLVSDFEIGPVHLQAMAVRVGDAFYDWLSVGFQVSILNMPFGVKTSSEDPKLGGFGLYLDTTFYPWRGLGLRPSVGLGFSFAQDGPEAFQLGFGGPANLAFALSYEFRITRLFTMGPTVQVSWISGEDYDAFFLLIGLEILKWFKTAKG